MNGSKAGFLTEAGFLFAHREAHFFDNAVAALYTLQIFTLRIHFWVPSRPIMPAG